MKKIIIILCFSCFAHGFLLSAQNIMKTGLYEVTPNEEFTVEIEVNNAEPFVAFQVDIPLPENFSYVNGSAMLNASRASGHLFSAGLQAGNVLRLIAYSTGNSAFTGNSGVVANFRLKSGKIPGDFPLLLQNVLLGGSQSQNILTGTQDGNITLVAPRISLSSGTLDFGRVALQSVAGLNLQISNTGNSELIINSLAFTGSQFSTSETMPISIAANSSRNITVNFAPTAKGVLNSQLYVSSNDPDQAALTVSLQAVAYAVNELHTGNLNGASNSTQTLEFSINNMENFTGFQFDMALPEPMSYVENSVQLFRANGHSVVVNQIDDHTLRVLAFSVSNAVFTGTEGKILSLDFQLEGNAGAYPLSISNVMIVDNSAVNIVSDFYPGILQITSAKIVADDTMDFGNVSILEEKEMNYRIYNYGQEPLVIDRLLFSNPCFTTSQTLPLTILPAESFDLKVKFQKNEKSVETGDLKIFSNDPEKNPFVVQLSANAYIPNILKVDSQSMNIGDTQTEIAIEIENEEDFVAFQFDLTFPAGIVPDISNIALTERKQDHIVSAVILPDNSLRIMAYSLTQKPFSGKSGAVLKIPFTVETALSIGTYNLSLSNSLISSPQSENVLWDVEAGILTVDKMMQTITFDALPEKAYGDPVFELQASVNSNLPVAFESSNLNVATVSGNMLTIVNAGTATITASVAGDNNYFAANPVQQQLTVNKTSLTVTPEDVVREYGKNNPEFVLIYSGFKNNETEDVLSEKPVATTDANAASDVGDYDITVSGGAANNYEFAYLNGKLTIKKAFLTITAENKQREQGEENPIFTLLYSGFKNGENESILDVLPTISCTANINSLVGFYDIILSGGSDNNYDYSLINGKLEVIAPNSLGKINVSNISVYPNPAKNYLFIQSDYPIEKIEIYNQSGMCVLINDNVIEKLDVSSLANGFYLARIYEDGILVIKKIIIKK